MIPLTDDSGRPLPGAPGVAPCAGFVARVWWAGRGDAPGPEVLFFPTLASARDRLEDPRHDRRRPPRVLADGAVEVDCTLSGCLASVAVLTPVEAGRPITIPGEDDAR